MDQETKDEVIKTLEEKIQRLVKARDALLRTSTSTTVTEESSTTGMIATSSPATSKKGHVSEEAKKRLKEEMTLRWKVRKAKTKAEKDQWQKQLDAVIAQRKK